MTSLQVMQKLAKGDMEPWLSATTEMGFAVTEPYLIFHGTRDGSVNTTDVKMDSLTVANHWVSIPF